MIYDVVGRRLFILTLIHEEGRETGPGRPDGRCRAELLFAAFVLPRGGMERALRRIRCAAFPGKKKDKFFDLSFLPT